MKPPYNVSELNQKAALDCLQDEEAFQEEVALLKRERSRVAEALTAMLSIKKVYPSEANFLLTEVTDADRLYKALLGKGIITRNRNKQVRNTLRITIGSPEENNQLLQALNQLA